MYPDAASTLLNFDSARTVSSSQQPSSEPTNWAGELGTRVQAAVEDAATLDVIERSSAEQFADQARLRQRINELPAVQARLVRMSYFEAKSHSEIADALGMPLGTVKSHLRRAFLQLQAKVGGAL